MVWVGGSEVIQVVGGLEFGFEEEAGSVLGAGEEERGTPVDKVRLLVVVGFKVVDGREYSVLVGVAEDVTERGEDTSVVTQRHNFANKGPSNQSYGFSSSHVWM